MASHVLIHLLENTWSSPVFGDAFGENASTQTPKVISQIEAIASGFISEFRQYIAEGMPEMSQQNIEEIVNQSAPKTVSFCPALTGGEVDDIPRLTAVAVAVGLMYWGDQTMDRGDTAMFIAIRVLGDPTVSIPKSLRSKVLARLQALHRIEDKINSFARGEDVSLVLACFYKQVLVNEARLHQYSLNYLKAHDPHVFLAKHAVEIASLMTIDAGFPSVSSSLYTIYRQQQPTLPSLQDVYSEPAMVETLQICNAVVRIADELGDWDTDSGHDPAWGVFCINLFNQPHHALLHAFYDVAGIHSLPLRSSLSRAFNRFHGDPSHRKECGEYILNVFLDHIRRHITQLPPNILDTYKLYITLCKRVLEIGYINKVGDVALADHA